MNKRYSSSIKNIVLSLKPSNAIRLLLMVLFVSLFSIVSNAQILQRDVATTNAGLFTGTGRAITINKPIGVVVGDVLIASIVQNETDNDNGGLSNISASGWSLVTGGLIRSDGTNNNDNAWWGTYLYRIADGTEGANFSFALPSDRADMAIGSIVAFSGVAVTGGVLPNGAAGGPFDAATSAFTIGNNSNPTVSAITTVTPNASVILLAQVNNNRTFSNWVDGSASLTLGELYDNLTTDQDDAGLGAAWGIQSSAGSTGTCRVTMLGSDRWSAILIALRPCTANPTITSTGTAASICFSTSAQTTTLPYTATTSIPISYSIDWNAAANAAGLADQTTTSNTFVAGAGNIPNIAIPASLVSATYNGILSIITAGGCRTTQAINVTVNPLLSNNNLTYTNGTSLQVSVTSNEGLNAVLNAATGTYFAFVNFASYGTPTGTAPNFAINPACHASTSQAVAEAFLLGNTTATIPVTNGVFGDPCVGTFKSLNVVATYVEPLCSGSAIIISGSLPTGGNGSYTYLWESSTTSATSGFTAASGTNNTISYSSGTITQNTWYRRAVTSGGCTSISAVVAIRLRPILTAPTLGTLTQPTCTTNTGSVVLNGLPTGSWILTRSPDNVTTTGTGSSTTISGLVSGNTYSYSVDTVTGANGLIADYFNNTTLSGIPALTRTDATVDFNWVNGNPGPPINNDSFSVRWSGEIQPQFSETYIFSTNSDDGTRLWINGVQILNNWTNQAATNIDSTPITLVAGQRYSIVLEYYENAGQASSRLLWRSPSQPSQIIPTTSLFPIDFCASPASPNIVMNAQPSTPIAPTIATPTQPNCVTATGSLVLSGLPSGSWTVNALPVTSGLTGLTGSTSTTTVAGLTANTNYTFTVTNSNGCTSLASSSVAINPVITTTYDGTTWSTTPNITMIGIISVSGSIATSVDLCSCTVNTGVNVVVNSGVTLKLQDRLTVSGTLTFQNNASLVQINDVNNAGNNITYIRNNNSTRQTDYTYWSSPVANQQLGLVSPLTSPSMFYSFNSALGTDGRWVAESTSNPMTIGKGYIIGGVPQPPPPASPGFYTASFFGAPNNGPYTILPITADRSYLLGNPYPSAIDADEFLFQNRDVLYGTLYFWTHNTEIGQGTSNNGSEAFPYTTNDYASYNATGGVGATFDPLDPAATAAAPSGLTGGQNASVPNGYIAAGQGFFATSRVATGNIVFNNNMRLSGTTLPDNTGINQQFFRTKNPKSKIAQIEKNRVWLNLTNTRGAFKQTLVGYITGATNDIDDAFDGESFDGQEFVDFYSINQDKNLTIQGRALPFDENDEVPLGFRSTIAGPFSISIDQVDGSMTNQPIFIEDKLTNTVFDLKSGKYTFNTAAGTFDNRFVLSYTNKTLGTTDFDAKGNTVLISIKNQKIQINSFTETIDKVTIFDLLGRQIYQKDKVNNNELLLSDFVSSHQTLIVKTSLQNGNTVSDKVIY